MNNFITFPTRVSLPKGLDGSSNAFIKRVRPRAPRRCEIAHFRNSKAGREGNVYVFESVENPSSPQNQINVSSFGTREGTYQNLNPQNPYSRRLLFTGERFMVSTFLYQFFSSDFRNRLAQR